MTFDYCGFTFRHITEEYKEIAAKTDEIKNSIATFNNVHSKLLGAKERNPTLKWETVEERIGEYLDTALDRLRRSETRLSEVLIYLDAAGIYLNEDLGQLDRDQ